KSITVFVSDGSQTKSENLPIAVKALPIANAGLDTATCLGNAIKLTASGGVAYQWNTGSFKDSTIVSPITPTTYKVTVTAINGCKSIDEIMVGVKTLPSISVSGNQEICFGDTATLTASGGLSYAWSSGGNNTINKVTPSTFTNYSVTGTAANGCSNSSSISVLVNSLPTVDAGLNTSLCAGSYDTLSASGALFYTWSNNQN